MIIAVPASFPLEWIRETSPNRRHHWSGLAKARARLREDFAWLLYADGTRERWEGHGPLQHPVLHILAVGPRLWDDDNLAAACKAARDAYQDVGLVSDDREIHAGRVRSVALTKTTRPRLLIPADHHIVCMTLIGETA